MPETVKRFHTVKMSILQALKTYKEIVPQKLNDAEGEVGYVIRFYPQSIELGQKIAEALRAEGIRCNMRGQDAPPDWHIYRYMFAITEKTGATEDNCPFECPLYLENGGRIEYAAGDCPVADDLFDRMISVPLNQWYTAYDCANIANGINKVLSAYCTQDPNARGWL